MKWILSTNPFYQSVFLWRLHFKCNLWDDLLNGRKSAFQTVWPVFPTMLVYDGKLQNGVSQKKNKTPPTLDVMTACGLKHINVDLLIYLVTAFAKPSSGVPTKGPYRTASVAHRSGNSWDLEFQGKICEACCEEEGKYHMNQLLGLLLLMLHFSAWCLFINTKKIFKAWFTFSHTKGNKYLELHVVESELQP